MNTTHEIGRIRIAERHGVRKATGREHYVVKLAKPDGSVFEVALTPQEIFDASQRRRALGAQLT